MKPTTEGSRAVNFDMVCMSFGKEQERGLKVVQGAAKNSIFNEDMELKAEDGILRENDTIESASGKIVEFKKGTYKKVKQNRKMKSEKGIILNYEEKVARKSNKIVSYEEEVTKKSNIDRVI